MKREVRVLLNKAIDSFVLSVDILGGGIAGEEQGELANFFARSAAAGGLLGIDPAVELGTVRTSGGGIGIY